MARSAFAGWIGAAAVAVLTVGAPMLGLAAERIGVATTVKNDVRGQVASEVREIDAGDDVQREEEIETGSDSATQLLFLDRTSVTLGSNARLTLNKFVYDPDKGSGEVVLGAAKGAFRLISGLAKGDGYKVETPRATIGVRGSIIEGYVDPISGEEIHVLVQGVADVCPRSGGECVRLVTPGTFARITAQGEVVGPATWRGSLLSMNMTEDLTQRVRDDTDAPNSLAPSPELGDAAPRFTSDPSGPAPSPGGPAPPKAKKSCGCKK